SKNVDSQVRSKATFFPAASTDRIKELESALKTRIPSALQALLLETNGVMEMVSTDGGEWFNDLTLIWSIDEMIEKNLFFRKEKENGVYEREFDQLLFFSGAGCDGILFGHPTNENREANPEVVVWSPIGDELTNAAPDLQTFLENWCTGRLSV